MNTNKPVVVMSEEEMTAIYSLAKERFENPMRKHSPTRYNARSIDSQYRGALGEYAASKWVTHVLGEENLGEGFLDDVPSESDLTIGGRRIEVMTALREHQIYYGYCVPPSKLQAAKNRGSLGYLFVTVEGRSVRDRATIDWYCDISNVDNEPYIVQDNGIKNYICQTQDLVHPTKLVEQFKRSRNA